MEVAQEISNKKRKADVSLVVGSSSEGEVITPSHLLHRRRRRRNRLVDPSPEKENISDSIDLTADYETPHGPDYTDIESTRKEGSTKKEVGRIYGGTDSKVKFSTPKKGGKAAIFGSKIDFKPDLDSISRNQLLGMSATNAGFIGLECVEVVEAVRAKSKNFQGSWSGHMRVKLNKVKDVIRTLAQKAESAGDPSLFEARELSNELLAAKWDSDKKKIEFEELKVENENLRKEIAGAKSRIVHSKKQRKSKYRRIREKGGH
ncbi:phage-related protein [Lasius niger]|uniref:Phage-related protein n=1 Tax=Lasius niger TaxID=67767 RepID=A0A0J7MZF7_LASNI|nr:phage-related protein [Lasius niger]